MAIIEVVKFDGPADVFAWKYPNQELGTWTQLIVNETQEAILFKGGKALDVFPAGRHTLSTANIPLLQEIVNLPFGGRSPFTAEVWYVNKIHALDVKWGTATPLQLQDPKYQIIVSVRSFGQFGLQIEDARKFLLKLIGTIPVFDKDAMVKHFRGLLMMNIKELISSYLVFKKISVLEINAYMSEISKHIEERIEPVFAEFGIRVLNFYIDSINTPDDDPATARLKEALAKRAEMDILGYTYQQERTFDTLEGAARNEGSGSANVMGAGIGLGMGFGVGGAVGNQMSSLTNQMNIASPNKACPKCQKLNPQEARFCLACGHDYMAAVPTQSAEVQCSNCGKTFPAGAKFCLHCGDPNNACEQCGADNPQGATKCYKCGHSFGGNPCHQCGTEVDPEGKFCTNCGTSMVLKCGKCQHEVKPGQKFCLECGNKLIE
ncbi:SPFH domain-containing protein [Cohnella terricola]|uniref:SPFH domain-containing protein n=1 Tax=Cohnella terricola TaxID=1289167 RepID=A0A559JJ65_9BACL|nr:SPFH domain-containing protein [Cohnella terricola]TVX99912.1 SPFH domain-containing protein [Cohnella terricola]